jgi:hypothetical protein
MHYTRSDRSFPFLRRSFGWLVAAIEEPGAPYARGNDASAGFRGTLLGPVTLPAQRVSLS